MFLKLKVKKFYSPNKANCREKISNNDYYYLLEMRKSKKNGNCSEKNMKNGKLLNRSDSQ